MVLDFVRDDVTSEDTIDGGFGRHVRARPTVYSLVVCRILRIEPHVDDAWKSFYIKDGVDDEEYRHLPGRSRAASTYTPIYSCSYTHGPTQ
jgi:hypothetical protein